MILSTRSIALVCGLAIVLLSILASPAMSAIDEKTVHRAMVRVEANGNAASGFVYGVGNKQIVTALHAVLPKTPNIQIVCRGNYADASVVKVLREADLVLLEVTDDLEEMGCKGLSNLSTDRPGLGDDLYAFGFRPDNTSSAFSKPLIKGSGDPETLETLVPNRARGKVGELAMPSVKLELYYVNGGVFPGFSGGPVFNKTGDLIGVVQGGLDKGTSNHDWLIPASNINRLLAPDNDEELPNINPSEFGYSSPAAVQSKANYIEKQDENFYYKWVKMKTRTFEELKDSSNPAEGLDQLLDSILPEVETKAQRELAFDIYQELELGLIIAVPAGQLLEYQLREDDEWYLMAGGFGNEQAGLSVQHGELELEDIDGNTILPSNEDFFELVVEKKMFMCEQDGMICEADEALFRIVDFGGGNKILRIGFVIADVSTGKVVYDYMSVLVKGNEAMFAQSVVNVSEDSPVLKCIKDGNPEACGAPYWESMSFLLAAQLTSFSSLVVDDGDIQIYTWDSDLEGQDSGVDDTTATATVSAPAQAPEQHAAVNTLAVTYYAGSVATFKHQGGDSWWAFLGGQYVSATEVSRDSNAVIVIYANILYSIPIAGGTTYQAPVGGNYEPFVNVVQQPNFDTSIGLYYQDSTQMFQHQSGNAWFININGQWQAATETSRNLHSVFLQYGDIFYYLPIQGGQYHWGVTLEGPWAAAGVVEWRPR